MFRPEKINPGEPEPEKEKRPKLEIRAATQPSERHPDHNEDAILLSKEGGLFAIFDGIGGHAGGEIASDAAKKVVEGFAKKEFSNPDLTVKEAEETMKEVLKMAHIAIVAEQMKLQQKEYKMGTTASIVKILKENDKTKAVIGNIGDSRVYILRSNRQLEQVTADDSEVRSVFKEGLTIEDEKELKDIEEKINEAKTHEGLGEKAASFFLRRRVITKSLGMEKFELEPENVKVVDLNPGDKLIATSDGIHDNLTGKEMLEILTKAQNSQEAAENLVKAAQEVSRISKSVNIRAKPDDMTAIAAFTSEKANS